MLLGPIFVAAAAYVDSGNIAASITAGTRYGYLFVWAPVLANLMVVLVQYESAKLGIVIGRSLSELLGDKLPKPRRIALWLQAEVVAAVADLAKVIGGATALYLSFGVPLLWGGVITGVVSLILLLAQNRNGQIAFECLVISLLLIIILGFVPGLLFSPPDWGGVLGGIVPRFRGSETIAVVASILGATVMSHAIYLHSSLVEDRHRVGHSDSKIKVLLQASRFDVVWALSIVGCVNIVLLLLVASALPGKEGTDAIGGVYGAILGTSGTGVATVSVIGLLASGLASTSVGAYADSEIMAGLLHIYAPLRVRRIATLIPALAILALGSESIWSPVIFQAVPSMEIPLALVSLIVFTCSWEVMGKWRDPWRLFAAAVIVAALITVLSLAPVAMGQF